MRLLAICLPTYNRAGFLKEALASILSQATAAQRNRVEIVVSDNASTDQTEKTVAELAKGATLPVRYFRNEKNVGFDANCLKAVERAQARYCWLLGDDDLLAAGALARVLLEIEKDEGVDLFLGEKEDFYLTPDRPIKYSRIMRQATPQIYDFRSKEVVDAYFRRNKKLIAFFNFISVIVFKRDPWFKVAGKEKFVGSGYIHLYTFWSMLFGGQKGVMKYLPYDLARRRWGEDRMAGVKARLKNDVQVYRTIACGALDDECYVRTIDNLVIKNDGFSWAVRARIVESWGFYSEIFPFLLGYYWSFPLFWLKIFPLLFVPRLILKMMRGTYRKIVKGEPLSLKEIGEG